MKRLACLASLAVLTGCAPLAVQIAAVKFAQGIGEKDLAKVRERSTARLNREVWDEFDPRLLDRLRELPALESHPKAKVSVKDTIVEDARATIHLVVAPENREPFTMRVELADEDGWRVDDIVIGPDGLSLRGLAGCFVTMHRAAESLLARDFDGLRRVASADLRERVVEEVAKLDFKLPEVGGWKAPEVRPQGMRVGESEASFAWSAGDDTFAFRLKKEDGAWRIDDVDSPGGSLKLMFVAGLAALRLLQALGAGDKEAIRAAATPEFWDRALSRVPDEVYEAVRGIGGKPGGSLAGWPTVVETPRGLRLAVDFGLHRIEADVVDRRVDDVRLGGVSVAEHIDIGVTLLGFAQAFAKGDRQALIDLSEPALAAVWRDVHEEGLSMVARLFRGTHELPRGEGGAFAVKGDSATLSAGDFSVRLARREGRWRIATAIVPVAGKTYSIEELVPVADPLLTLWAGVDGRSVATLKRACTPALNRMAWDLATDEMLGQAMMAQMHGDVPRGAGFEVTLGEKACELRLGAARATLVRDDRWRLDDVVLTLEGREASMRRALGVAIAAWRFAEALRKGDLEELKREASSRLRADVLEKVSLENQKTAVGGARELDLTGAKLGAWDLPESGSARVEIALSNDRSVRFAFEQEDGRYRADDVVLRAGKDELSLRKALKIGVAFGR